MMDRLKIPHGEAIESGMVSRSIESAQRKVEGHNFDIRKQLLEYDDVANDQRRVIYAQRNELLDEGDTGAVRESVNGMRDDVLEQAVRIYVPEGSIEEQWQLHDLEAHLLNQYSLDIPIIEWMNEHRNATDEDLIAHIQSIAKDVYQAKIDRVGEESFQNFERVLMRKPLITNGANICPLWITCVKGIHLRGYAQRKIRSKNTSAKRLNYSA